MTKENLLDCFIGAGKEIISAKDELTAIDAKYGDGDHGITMEKIAGAFLAAMDTAKKTDVGVNAAMEAAADAIMAINGGAAVPLWTTLFGGFAEAPGMDAADIGPADLKTLFAGGLRAIRDVTKAEEGDKTLMDALIPAVRAMEAWTGDDAKGMLAAAAAAAKAGAEATKNYAAKYGRAKNYKEATLGTMDAGALSMARFFAGLCE
ncbi:MAG: DAK2 domain-containing protein [Fusobacteriaceae bacterium]|jgi:dihydroxyacetone kinase-like protein|nr:DAK2 domain-containing protein [Fusobacteriaceae bacterium]